MNDLTPTKQYLVPSFTAIGDLTTRCPSIDRMVVFIAFTADPHRLREALTS